MIQGVTGLIGHGKNCFVTRQVLRLRARGDKRRVIANFPLHVEGVEYCATWDEVKNESNCLIIIDEAYRWFGSRNWQNNNREGELSCFTQSRKEGNSFWWICQESNQVDQYLREFTTAFIWHVYRPFGPGEDEGPSVLERLIGCRAVARKYSASIYGKADARPVESVWFKLNDYFGAFDTFHSVGLRDGSGAGRGKASGAQRPTPGPERLIWTPDTYRAGRVEPFPGVVKWVRSRVDMRELR